jgi:hypothetical protein
MAEQHTISKYGMEDFQIAIEEIQKEPLGNIMVNSLNAFIKMAQEQKPKGMRKPGTLSADEKDAQDYWLHLSEELKQTLPGSFFKRCIVCDAWQNGIDRGEHCGGKVKISLCTGCRCVYYCSRDCQLRHWKEGGHKDVCQAIQRHPASQSGSAVKAKGDFDYCKVHLHLLAFLFHPSADSRAKREKLMHTVGYHVPHGAHYFPVTVSAMNQAVLECLSQILSNLFT